MTPGFRVWMVGRAAIRDYTGIWRSPNDDEILREAKTWALRQEFGRDWLLAERMMADGCR